MIRETLKRVTKQLGVYGVIRDTKQWIVNLPQRAALLPRIAKVMGVPLSEVRTLSAEFDRSGLWQAVIQPLVSDSETGQVAVHGASGQQVLRTLYILCRLVRPDAAVETGVASGASAFVLLSALEKNGKGRLYSIDLVPEAWSKDRADYRQIDDVELPKGKAPGWLVPDSLRHRWQFIAGDVRKEIPKLAASLKTCGLWYHDAEHSYDAMKSEFEAAWPLLQEGGCLVSDDIDWNQAFTDFYYEVKGQGTATTWDYFGIICKRSPPK